MVTDTINYVVSGQGFWTAMGWTSACGIFIGAIVHNGDLKSVWKGVVSVGAYIFFIVYVNISRLMGNDYTPIFQRHPNSTASIATNLFVALFYLFGMFLGVLTLWCLKNKLWTKFKKKLHNYFV